MKKSRLPLVLLIILALILAGCNPGSPAAPADNPPAPPDQAGSPTAAPQQPAAQSKGPGDFDLSSPAAGLENLQSYRQSLRTSFDGQIGAEQRQSSLSLVREVVNDPPTRLSWLEMDGKPAQFYGRMGSVEYRQPAPDANCTATAATDAGGQPSPAELQLATLPPIFGATLAGEEQLNGVSARHYTFDERALGLAGQAVASGEVWVAASGGYILRYTLRLDAPADLLGPEVSGVQTWTYELSEIDAGKTSLPQACQPLQADIPVPVLENAVMLQQEPGYWVYQVTSGIEPAIAFYQQQAEALGWKIGTPTAFGDVTRLSLRPPDGSLAQLTLQAQGDLLTVTVQTLAPMPTE
ncbi:MAG: hypothetical protein HY835_01765 [Anaerolineae bacterium]|nr:hypothetical protein [Anaerolineae bacterium]